MGGGGGGGRERRQPAHTMTTKQLALTVVKKLLKLTILWGSLLRRHLSWVSCIGKGGEKLGDACGGGYLWGTVNFQKRS